MLKIEFPAENKALAAAIGKALTKYAGEQYCSDEESARRAALRAGTGPVTAVRTQADGAVVTTTAHQHGDTVTHETTAVPPDAAVVATELPAGTDDEPTNDAPADGRKDQKGVVFNPTFCANAKEPFYSSGAMLGQWKKARGCDQGAYDAWYANELGKVQANWQEKSADLGVNTNAAAAAFSSQAAAANTQTVPVAPTTGGELMKWVSERQAANVLNQADIDSAWAATGFGVADLFGPNAAAVLASVYGILSAKAGA